MECSCTISIDHDGGPDCWKEKIDPVKDLVGAVKQVQSFLNEKFPQ